MPVPVFFEVGTRRIFASAVGWPGWCRSGRTEAEALAALVAYAPRYTAAVREVAPAFVPPADAAELEVVERVAGGAGTDFGAPGVPPSCDSQAVDEVTIEPLIRLLEAAWHAVDRAAAAAAGRELRKGPRGGGSDRDRIVDHVLGAEQAYVAALGGPRRTLTGADPAAMVRRTAVDTLGERARGVVPPLGPGRTRPCWTPRFCVRCSAWHALDHAWEIEDRVR